MRTLSTLSVTDPQSLSGPDRYAFYNGLDCMLCAEIHEAQQLLLDSTARATVAFTFGLQRPATKMALRGILIDPQEKERLVIRLEANVEKALHILNTYAMALWKKPLNPGSWMQKAEFLYGFCAFPEQTAYDKEKGGMRPTTNREALEKLRAAYFKAEPLCLAILAYQDAKKALGILRSGIDPDGRMRTSFVVAGPVTGRFASRKNPFGRGSNFQNWRESWRVIFTTQKGPLPNREQFSIPEQFRSLPPQED